MKYALLSAMQLCIFKQLHDGLSGSAKIERIVNDYPYVTIEELQAERGMSHGTFNRIIFDHLDL